MMKERVEMLTKSLGINKREFAERIGMSAGGMSSVLSGRQGLSKIALVALRTVFNVNTDWLLTGEGEMFLEGDKPTILSETEKEFLEIFRKIPKKDLPKIRAILETFLPK